MSAEEALVDLLGRLANASDALGDLAHRPTNSLSEQQRLMAKKQGVALAISYAREALAAAT